MNRGLIMLVLLALLSQGGPSANAQDAAPKPGPVEAQVLSAASLPPVTDAKDCGVPVKGTFGKDVEAFRGAGQGLGYAVTPAWGPQELVAASAPQGPVTAAVTNTEQIVALWKVAERNFVYAIWSGSWKTAQPIPPTPTDSIGNPSIISSGTGTWEVYLSGTSGRVYWWQPGFTTWHSQLKPGFDYISDAASQPAVVTTGPQHTLLFYWDHQGKIRFTERQGMVGTEAIWRDQSLILQLPQRMYLPVVGGKAPAAASALTENSAENDLASAPSELSAVSPDGDHAAVFYVDGRNRLWVIDWTNKNKSDWSDARWSVLMNAVKIEKPAAASRHVKQMAVAVRDTQGMAYIIEWTAETGWKAPYALGKNDFAGPLAVAPTFVDSLSVFGVTASGMIWQKNWADNAWKPWTQVDTGGQPVNPPLSAVVNHPNDILLVYSTPANQVASRHFTSLYRAPDQQTLVSPGVTSGDPHGQALIWVDGKTLWVTAVPGDTYWKIHAVGTGLNAATLHAEADLSYPHEYQASTNPSIASSDFDKDGDEEIAIVTWRIITSYLDKYYLLYLAVLDFEVGAGGVTITVTDKPWDPVYSMTLSSDAAPAGLSTSLAFGDLNGDGVANELVLTYTRPQEAYLDGIYFKVYQIDPATRKLALRVDAMLPGDRNWDLPYYVYSYNTSVQVAVGNLYGLGSKEQIAVSIVTNYLDTRNCAYHDWCFNAFPTLRTYELVSSNNTWDPGTWQLKAYNDKLTAYKDDALVINGAPNPHYWWTMLYKNNGSGGGTSYGSAVPKYAFHFGSALDTGDLDGDGREEIAFSYLDKLMVINPDLPPEQRIQQARLDEAIPVVSRTNFNYTGLMRSLAVGDMDEDGKAEILTETFFYNNFLAFLASYVPKLNVFGVMGDGKLLLANTFPLPTPGQGGKLNAILMGDLDNDTFASELKYCIRAIPDYRIVAVLNGAPRWYDPVTGKPINDSRGYYTTTDGMTTGQTKGTSYNRGASLSVGFKMEINVPVVGTKIGETSRSVKAEVMETNGISEGQEKYDSYSSTLFFESGPGIVVYRMTTSDCYFYELYRPGFEQNKSKAITCTPGPLDDDKFLKDLTDWNEVERVASWADVGHRAPGRGLSNDLGIPGNYRPYLPVDSFLVLYEAKPIHVGPSSSQTGGDWSWTLGTRASRTSSHQQQLNITSSAGIEVFGFTVETSSTGGLGSDSSETMSWSDELTFYGRVWNFDKSFNRQCYTVVPFVYEAQAKTLAGVVYPYWEMDYYVPDIGKCY